MKRHHYLPKAGACILISLIILNVFTIGSGAKLNRSEWNGTSTTTVSRSLPIADAGITDPEINTEKNISLTNSDQTSYTQTAEYYTDEVIKSDNNSTATSEFSEKDTQSQVKTEYKTDETEYIDNETEYIADAAGYSDSSIYEEEYEESYGEDAEEEERIVIPAPLELYPGCISYELPEYEDYEGFKSYESYTALRADCPQGHLQRLAESDEYGFRKINGRYLVAIGTYFNAPVGTWFDLILENGTRIYCIVGDIKDDKDTDAANIYTVHSRCCSEFLVSMNDLQETVKRTGDCSYLCSEWNSPVAQLIVYDINELE